MLTEYKNKQSSKDMRWFSDDDMDLTVWLQNTEIVRFQIRFFNSKIDIALTWSNGEGLLINQVDSGTNDPRYNRSPTLSYPETSEWKDIILEEFKRKSKNVDNFITAFILKTSKSK